MIGELLPGCEHPPHRGRQVVDGDLDLSGAHSLVRRYQSLYKQVTFCVVVEKDGVTVSVVLENVLGKRVQRLGHVSGGGEDS